MNLGYVWAMEWNLWEWVEQFFFTYPSIISMGCEVHKMRGGEIRVYWITVATWNGNDVAPWFVKLCILVKFGLCDQYVPWKVGTNEIGFYTIESHLFFCPLYLSFQMSLNMDGYVSAITYGMQGERHVIS